LTNAEHNTVNVVFEADTDDPRSYEGRVQAWMKSYNLPIARTVTVDGAVVVLAVPTQNLGELRTLLADIEKQPEGTHCVQIGPQFPGQMSQRIPGAARSVDGGGSRLKLNALPRQIDFER